MIRLSSAGPGEIEVAGVVDGDSRSQEVTEVVKSVIHHHEGGHYGYLTASP